MPYAVLLTKPRVKPAGDWLASRLPEIIASALSVKGRELHDGKVTDEQIMVIPLTLFNTINGQDLELIVLAHDFPERLENIEERREMIQEEICKRLIEGNAREMTVAVCIVTTPMAYGDTKLTKS